MPIFVVGFFDRGWYDVGIGKLLTTPTVGGLAVLLAALIAYRSNNRKMGADRQATNSKIAADREESDRKIVAVRSDAIAARSQERRAVAYVEIIDVDERTGLWIQLVQGPLDRPVPELPSVAEQAKAQAQLLAFGSLKVRCDWESWNKEVKDAFHSELKIRVHERTMQDHAGDPATVLSATHRRELAYEALDKNRQREAELRAALHARMNAELAEEHR